MPPFSSAPFCRAAPERMLPVCPGWMPTPVAFLLNRPLTTLILARSGSSGVYAFTVDTKAPRTKIVGHPKKVVKTRKHSVLLGFRLKASESPVTFYCQFDKEPLRICPARFKQRFKKGEHAVRIRAKDQVGNIAAKPTVFHFRVTELPPRHRAKK